jgi:hypothetical protein
MAIAEHHHREAYQANGMSLVQGSDGGLGISAPRPRRPLGGHQLWLHISET